MKPSARGVPRKRLPAVSQAARGRECIAQWQRTVVERTCGCRLTPQTGLTATVCVRCAAARELAAGLGIVPAVIVIVGDLVIDGFHWPTEDAETQLGMLLVRMDEDEEAEGATSTAVVTTADEDEDAVVATLFAHEGEGEGWDFSAAAAVPSPTPGESFMTPRKLFVQTDDDASPTTSVGAVDRDDGEGEGFMTPLAAATPVTPVQPSCGPTTPVSSTVYWGRKWTDPRPGLSMAAAGELLSVPVAAEMCAVKRRRCVPAQSIGEARAQFRAIMAAFVSPCVPTPAVKELRLDEPCPAVRGGFTLVIEDSDDDCEPVRKVVHPVPRPQYPVCELCC